ncbi:isopentenyl-diphosphate Delta-isomerase [Hyphomonas sp.]|uniref:isopentenyl-diphosphate Delta-isomerase n=1 Tax=Hyphomonas sp. TaxID=87 RepID=UPI00391D2D7B
MDDQFEQVILVDEADRMVTPGDKWQIHQEGRLHRAFSVFIFDAEDRCLIQRRAAGKYHSAGKWANSCCGHPRPGEPTGEAAERRLVEEIGLRVPLTFGFKSRYVAYLDNEMIENEIPHIYFGRTSDVPVLNPDEVSDIAWISLEALRQSVRESPEAYAAWLVHYIKEHADALATWRARV